MKEVFVVLILYVNKQRLQYHIPKTKIEFIKKQNI